MYQTSLVSRAMDAFRSVGFIALKGHGVSPEDFQHHFDLGKMFIDEVSNEEKHKLHARIAQEGSWAGYKVGLHAPWP